MTILTKILLSGLNVISKAVELVLITAILSRYASPEVFINFHKIQNLIQIFVGFGGGFINSTVIISLAPLKSNGNKSLFRIRAFNTIVAFSLFFLILIYLIIWWVSGLNFFEGSRTQALILFPLTIVVLVYTSIKISFLISQNRQKTTVIASIIAMFISTFFCLIASLNEFFSLVNFFLLVQGTSFLLVVTVVDIIKIGKVSRAGFLFKIEYLIVLIKKNIKLIIHSIFWSIVYPIFFLIIRYLIELNSGSNTAVEWEIYTRLGQSIFLVNSTVCGLFFVPEFLKTRENLTKNSLIFLYLKILMALNSVIIIFLAISIDWILIEIFDFVRNLSFFTLILYLSAEALHGVCWVFLMTLVAEKRIGAFWRFEGLFRILTIIGSVFAVTSYGSSAYYLVFFGSTLLLAVAVTVKLYQRNQLVS